MSSRKRSLGRDVFDKAPAGRKSKALKKIVEQKPGKAPATKQLEVKVKLTPSNIKHLERVMDELLKRGEGPFTRDELIRVAITLLSAGDF